MSPNEWVAFGVGVCSIATALLLALRWVIKSFLSELKPNSGSSIKDAIDRIDQRSLRLEQRVDSLFEIINRR
jgi:hypothetical protein